MSIFKHALENTNTDGTDVTSMTHFRDDQVCLGWQPKKSVWVTCGGKCDPGESIESCLRRESVEESGMTNIRIVSFMGVVPNVTDEKRVWAFACECDEDPQETGTNEIVNWTWFTLDTLPSSDQYVNRLHLALIRDELERRTAQKAAA